MDYNNVVVIVLKMMLVEVMMMIDAHFLNGNITQQKKQMDYQMKWKIGKKQLIKIIKLNIDKVKKECGGKELPMKILNKIKLMILMFNSMVLTVSILKDPQKIQKIDLL